MNVYMAGCAQRYGGVCSCGDKCRCSDCPIHGKASQSKVSTCCGKSQNKSSSQQLNAQNDKSVKQTDLIQRQAPSIGKQSSFGTTISALSALSIDLENLEEFDSGLVQGVSANNTTRQTTVSEKEAEVMFQGCAMMYGGTCDCGPTCACVGCPIHDKNSAMFMQSRSTTNPYNFDEAVNNQMLRSTLLS